MTAGWRVTGVLLPDGDTVDAGVAADGSWTAAPPADAEPLPGRFVLPGLVDSHVHLSLDSGRKGLPAGSAELIAANRRDHLAAGVLVVRDIGTVSDE